MKDLAGRLAVVTGGCSGIGRELVRQSPEEAYDTNFFKRLVAETGLKIER